MKPIVDFFNDLPSMVKRWRYKPPSHHLTKSVPLFYFADSLFATSPAGTLELPNVPFWEAPLPFPAFWMYFAYSHPDPDRGRKSGVHVDKPVEHMIRAEPAGQDHLGMTLLTHYGRGASTLESPHRDTWSWLFVLRTFIDFSQTFSFDGGDDSGLDADIGMLVSPHTLALYQPDLETIEKENARVKLYAALEATAVKSAYFVKYAAWVLAQPTSLRIDEPALPDNRLRRARNLPPIPNTKRILHIDYKVLRRAWTGHHTGVEKVPHDRRAHRRTLHDGRVVNVRACKIHSGSKVPRAYEVRHDW